MASDYEIGRAGVHELSPEQAEDLFHLSADEREALLVAREVLLPIMLDVLAEHYRQLQLLPDAPKLLDNPEKIERLKNGVRGWLGGTVFQPDQADDAKSLRGLAIMHVRIGVPLSYIVAAFGSLQVLCMAEMQKSDRLQQMSSEEAIGVLNAFRKRISAEELGFVASYTEQADALAADQRTLMEKDIAARGQAISSTVSLSQAIANEISEKQILRTLADHIVKTFGSTFIEINMLGDGDTVQPALAVQNGEIADAPDNDLSQSVQRDHMLCSVARTGRPFFVPDVTRSLVTCPYQPTMMAAGCYCCLPIASGPKLLGWMHITHNMPGTFTEDNVEVLTIYGRMVGTSISSLRLMELSKRQAKRDPLTDLCNRRHFTEVIVKEQAMMDRSPAPRAMLMLDVDKFKDFNDTYGHDVGDDVLITLSRTLRECTRQVDEIARIGGDEIVLMLRDCPADQACQVAEKIIRQIGEVSIRIDETTSVSLNVSIGMAIFPDHAATLADAWRLADDALLEAKGLGRNRYVMYHQAEDAVTA